MLVLQSVAPAFGQKSASSFCLKAMFLLEMSGLDWRPDYAARAHEAPRGKLPVLVDGETLIPDSTDIARHLERVHGCDINPGLGSVDRARGHATARMMEEHFAQIMTYERWVQDGLWPHLKPQIFPGVPDQVADTIRTEVRKMSIAQGMGRLSPAEVAGRAAEDFDAIEVLLGDGPFLFGPVPVYADACVAPFLISVLAQPVATLLQSDLKSRPVLVDYTARVGAAFGSAVRTGVAA